MLEVKLIPVHEVEVKAKQVGLTNHPFDTKFPGRTVNIPGNWTGNKKGYSVETKKKRSDRANESQERNSG